MTTYFQFDCKFQYPSGFALDVAVDLSAPITALCGNSGCGKTTILSLIAGLLTPSSGRICLHDRVLFDAVQGCNLPPEQRHLGMLFQDHCLFPHLTVRENIEYGGKRNLRNAVRGIDNQTKFNDTNETTPQPVPITIEQIVTTLDIGKLLDKRPHTISGGQQQRVALARALATSPQMLLLDEPLTSVEPSLQKQLSHFIREIADAFHIPTLVVSHNRQLIHQLTDHVIEMEGSQLRSTNNDCVP